jgi:hypothetical protein
VEIVPKGSVLWYSQRRSLAFLKEADNGQGQRTQAGSIYYLLLGEPGAVDDLLGDFSDFGRGFWLKRNQRFKEEENAR